MDPESDPYNHPLLFVAQALSETTLICNTCKHDILTDLCETRYPSPQLVLTAANTHLNGRRSGSLTGDRASAYFARSGDAILQHMLRRPSSRAQLWLVLRGRLGLGGVVRADARTFVGRHLHRLSVVSFGGGCRCADGVVVRECGGVGAALGRVVWRYLGERVRAVVLRGAARDAEMGERLRVASGGSMEALVAMLESVQGKLV